jgi:hypothetical protein
MEGNCGQGKGRDRGSASTIVTEAGPLKVHGIFASNLVLQRDKPIMVWGWTESGKSGSVLTEEAKRSVEILERLKVLGQTKK